MPDTSREPNAVFGRASTRRRVIRRDLVDRIMRGEFSPGQKLPLRTELAQHYRAGLGTIQAVIDDLVTDGFLVAQVGTGSYVADRPPHLYHYALAFYDKPRKRLPWPRFHLALSRAARRLSADGTGRVIRQYFDLTEDPAYGDYPELLSDVRAQRLAGVVFVSANEPMARPVVEEGNMPRVHFSRGIHEGVHNIYGDGASWLKHATECLRRAGRRRVAVLSHYSPWQETTAAVLRYRENVAQAIRDAGLETRLEWVHQFPALAAPALSWVPLIWKASPSDTPDSLLIFDDHMVEGAVEGLLGAGLRVPDDVMVVGHCNYPAMPAPAAPVTFVGLDCEQLMLRSLSMIDQMRRGEEVPAAVSLGQQVILPPADAPAEYRPVRHAELLFLSVEAVTAPFTSSAVASGA
jgi:DNA-binding LacI/PurR family transcriptional regulator